ncbi:MAG: hypothetical protein ABIN67_05475 [Ferruginibacter sp.]
MKKNTTIRFINALALSLLFLLSNTPKKLVHSIFANHTDLKNGEAASHEGENLVPLSFHCQCDNLVVESPFTIHLVYTSVNFPKQYRKFAASLYNDIPLVYLFTSALRGPPVTA